VRNVSVHGETLRKGADRIPRRRGSGPAALCDYPTSGQRLQPGFIPATTAEVDSAVRLAEEAFDAYRRIPGRRRGLLLRTIAAKIESIANDVIERAAQETALPQARRATTLGVVANVWRFRDYGREILGFISYGYAQMLLRLDRIEKFLLFLYSHRYHAHTRGSWTAGEVTGIAGDPATYCVPAQQTIPLLVRWMLVLEDSDEDRLYLAKGLPREWVGPRERNSN
jgi:hypothetical protein